MTTRPIRIVRVIMRRRLITMVVTTGRRWAFIAAAGLIGVVIGAAVGVVVGAVAGEAIMAAAAIGVAVVTRAAAVTAAITESRGMFLPPIPD